jgi:hypothetical protein
MYKKIIPFLLLFGSIVIGFWQCKMRPKTVIVPAFYFWKNDADQASDSYSSANLFDVKTDSVHPKRQYVKVLEVDWNPAGGAYPRAKNDFYSGFSDTLQVVPTVFITNRVFENIKAEDLELLANRIAKKCIQEDYNYAKEKSIVTTTEVQVDCDWTATTRERYFDFLRKLKAAPNMKDVTLSATIRLYQYKYRDKTGVPPVDRGMIMLYNLSDLRKYEVANSIFDKKEAEAYLLNTPLYPLPVDVALPIFSWGVGYHDGKFVSLHNDFHPADVAKTSFLKKERDGYYEVIKDTVFQKTYYRVGDKMKIEYIDKQQLMDAAAVAKQVLNDKKTNVSFYHLDAKILSHYDKNDLKDALKLIAE